ncbi:MAG: 16S rRNA (guanine(966)-N(2))-methyltransferase RsmD [Proteobacteria bacterium]|nr:16S rRNA (guanine(966)-N(2))-methyltransferase RsmD [Pseudomonadota bacterium]
MAAPLRHKTKPRSVNRLRIIGGEWRGRRLSFPDIAGLRPTPDRVRETLFNWLAPMIEGTRCLDLFAGSGALGLEALSRGAASVVMVDSDATVIAHLHQHVAALHASGAQVMDADALHYLQHPPGAGFDIVFLDPPFRQNLVVPCCELLERGGWLNPGARIYIETESDQPLSGLPHNWHITRSKKSGQVSYHLAQR